jgi:hypothetical protein
MFIGAYACAGGIIFLAGLVGLAFIGRTGSVARTRREQVFEYTLFSLPIMGFILLVFVSLSISTRLMSFGEVQDWSYPEDYLAFGPVGWLLMFLPVLGVLSPLLVTIFMVRRDFSKR